MTVPKKRKKLDETEEPVIKSESGETVEATSHEVKPVRKSAPKTQKAKSEKVDKAFDVVDKIETSEHRAVDIQRYNSPSEQGIHIQFKLDLIRIEDILDIGKEKKPSKDNSIVIDFTIPYFWNLPILDEITKTIVKELVKMKIIQ